MKSAGVVFRKNNVFFAWNVQVVKMGKIFGCAK